MLTVLLGVCTAVFFGAADFLGGLAAKRMSALLATLLSAAAGLVVLTLALPLLGGTWSPGVLGWGIVAGVVAACTVALLYASLAIGPMSILAPLIGVISALVPAIFGAAHGERLGLTGYAGVAVALAAVVLVGLVPHREAVRPRPLGILLAAGAGGAMGTGIIVLDSTPPDSGILPLIIGRIASISIIGVALLAIALVERDRMRRAGTARTRTHRGRGVALGLAGGVLAASADVFMITGVRAGDVSVIGVLVALCSAVTVALAALVLRERLAPTQVAGLGLAIAAAVLFALG